MDFWRDKYGQKVVIPTRVLGYPLKIWNEYQPDELCMLECADDDGPTFHAGHGTHSVQKFFEVLNDYRKKHRMSNQLFDFDESEHDRTLGPPPPYPCRDESCDCEDGIPQRWNDGVSTPESDTYGIPLQEQVEQVEDALSKSISVIEALVEQEKELRNDVYQAQVDAQDWQNRANASNKILKEVRDALPRRYDGLYLESAARALHEDLVAAEAMAVPPGALDTTANLKRIKELEERHKEWDLLVEDRDMFQEQSRVRGLQLEESFRLRQEGMARIQELTEQNIQLEHTKRDIERAVNNNLEYFGRIQKLTDENTKLELRNERQAKRLGRILATVQGQHDDNRI